MKFDGLIKIKILIDEKFPVPEKQLQKCQHFRQIFVFAGLFYATNAIIIICIFIEFLSSDLMSFHFRVLYQKPYIPFDR